MLDHAAALFACCAEVEDSGESHDVCSREERMGCLMVGMVWVGWLLME